MSLPLVQLMINGDTRYRDELNKRVAMAFKGDDELILISNDHESIS